MEIILFQLQYFVSRALLWDRAAEDILVGGKERLEEYDSCSAYQVEDRVQALNNETKTRYSACQEG